MVSDKTLLNINDMNDIKIAEKVTLHDEIPFKLIHQISDQVIVSNLIQHAAYLKLISFSLK